LTKTKIPSPADAPAMTARQLLGRIRKAHGRVFRMRMASVFVLTSDEQLALWLIKLGGKRYTPINADPTTPAGSYRRAPDGGIEWDIYIHMIPVIGDTTIWEAAAKDTQIANAEEAA